MYGLTDGPEPGELEAGRLIREARELLMDVNGISDQRALGLLAKSLGEQMLAVSTATDTRMADLRKDASPFRCSKCGTPSTEEMVGVECGKFDPNGMCTGTIQQLWR